MYQNNSLKVGNNEGSLMTGVKLPNLLGRGERLQVCCEWTSSQCFYQSKTFKQDTGAWLILDTDYTCTILQADYTYGTKKSSNFNLSLLKPLRGKLRSALTGNIYQVLFFVNCRILPLAYGSACLSYFLQSNAEHPSSGFKQLDRGLLADFAFTSAPHVQHNLQVPCPTHPLLLWLWCHNNATSVQDSLIKMRQILILTSILPVIF